MNAFEELQQSSLWDQRFNGPFVPQHNNPHIYAAYITEVMMPHPHASEVLNAHSALIKQCLNPLSMYDIWPGGFKSQISIDELVGIASCSPLAASLIWAESLEHYGFYNNTGEKRPPFNSFIWRFPWAMAFIHRMAFGTCPLWLQFFWALKAATAGLFGDASANLLIWLTFTQMKKYRICRAGAHFWVSGNVLRDKTIYDFLIAEFSNSSWISNWAKGII